MPNILIVDDEQAVCWALAQALQQDGYQATVASSAEEAFDVAPAFRPDVIVLDVRLPGMDGLSAMGKLRELTNDAPVIIVTAFGDLNTAVKAVEGGAFDYLAKPFDLDHALETIARALQRRTSGDAEPDDARSPLPNADEIVGRSAAMQTVFKRIALVAPRESCVLITGESGTGKELVARALHRHSSRCDSPFLPVNIAALNPGLIESELFGHEKGAFTGAAQARAGLFALADGGTIFLDELADAPLSVQVKLLRVLEQNEILPVGGNQTRRLNVRVLAATHQDLQQRCAEGRFRHDLFFRLNVFQIHLPPLRARRDDIPPLTEYFLQRLEPSALPLSSETADYLQSLPWIGNVRELRNALEHAVILARGGPLSAEHFPVAPVGLQQSTDKLRDAVLEWVAHRIADANEEAPNDLYQELLNRIEPVLFEEVIRRVQGNRWSAAKWMGLNRATVRKKLERYGLADIS